MNPAVRDGHDGCCGCFLRAHTGRNREIRAPLLGTRRGARRKAKHAVRGRFDAGFEGAAHLNG